jgi:hypothetical protein
LEPFASFEMADPGWIESGQIDKHRLTIKNQFSFISRGFQRGIAEIAKNNGF